MTTPKPTLIERLRDWPRNPSEACDYEQAQRMLREAADALEAAEQRDAALREAIAQALSDLNTPGHLGGTHAVGGTNGIARRLRAVLDKKGPADV